MNRKYVLFSTLIILVILSILNCGPCGEIVENIFQKPETIEIFNKNLTIPSSSYKQFSCMIPKGAKIKGRMEVKEGDNIHLFLLDGHNYNSWQKGNQSKSKFIYESAYLQNFQYRSNKSVTYYLVMQNPAILNKKVVHLKITMTATKSQLQEAGLIE